MVNNIVVHYYNVSNNTHTIYSHYLHRIVLSWYDVFTLYYVWTHGSTIKKVMLYSHKKDCFTWDPYQRQPNIPITIRILIIYLIKELPISKNYKKEEQILSKTLCKDKI